MSRAVPARCPAPRTKLLAALALAFAGLFAGCTTALPVATSGDAARAGIQLADLQQGRSLVAAKCGGCHAPPAPAAHRSAEWPHMLDEMSARSHLDPAQRYLIEQYLVTMATR